MPHVKILVVEQLDHERTGITRKFNRGKLLNIGFRELWTNAEGVFVNGGHADDVFVAHDVDLVPDKVLFSCYADATHGVAVHLARSWDRYTASDKKNTRYVGGILALTCKDYIRTNGYSSMYWGWGGEDDDFRVRMSIQRIRVASPSLTNGRLKDLENMGLQEKLNLLRISGAKCTNKWELKNTSATRWRTDGLTSLKYHLCDITKSSNRKGEEDLISYTRLRVML